MSRNRRTLLALLALAAATALAITGCTLIMQSDASKPTTATPSSPTSISDDQLVIAISGMTTPKEGLTYYKGLSEYVGRKLGRNVRLIHKADYSELNEMLKDGRVDIAYSCSGPYARGHDEFGLQLVAAPVVKGSPTYKAYIIVTSSSDATSLVSLKGKTFAFTDPSSNTGCLVPTYMLAKMGTSPDDYFGRILYTYSHDNSIRAVAGGEVDGASVDSLIWDFLDAEDSPTTAKTRVLSESDSYGIPPVVARPGLDPGLVDEVRAAFLGADKDPEGRQLLEKMNIQRFVVIDDAAYDSIREMDAWVKKQNPAD